MRLQQQRTTQGAVGAQCSTVLYGTVQWSTEGRAAENRTRAGQAQDIAHKGRGERRTKKGRRNGNV